MMESPKHFFLSMAVAAVLLPSAAMAQGAPDAFPSRPVTVIVPVAAGGPNDMEARLYTTKMSGVMGQAFVLDYKPGAGSTIGTGYVAKSAPDGYTLLAMSPNFTILPVLYKDVPFDPLRDFAPVSLMGKRTTVLLVNPSFPAKTFADYMSYARSNPGKINFATAGAGSGTHLAGAWLHGASNTKVTFVHYKGGGPAMLDLIAGRVDVSAVILAPAAPQIKSGKLRALAIMITERSKLLPNLPTIAEQGVPGYNWATWLGFVAPAATPGAIVNKLSEGFARVSKMPDVIATLEATGSLAVGSTPAQFRQLLVAESAIWRKVIQDNGITLHQ